VVLIRRCVTGDQFAVFACGHFASPVITGLLRSRWPAQKHWRSAISRHVRSIDDLGSSVIQH
jgi:hypothetical protein